MRRLVTHYCRYTDQGGQPVAFHSQTLSPTKLRYPIVEKEAAAIINAVRKWSHYLHGQKILLITDQRAVAYMFYPQRTGKIKNMKLQIWKLSTNPGKIMWSLTLSQEFVVLHIMGLTSAKCINNLVVQALRGWYIL